MHFKDKVVWVTGASSGIGEALARALLQDGAWVILSGRRVGELERVASAAPERAHVLPFEATDYAALPGIVEAACAWRGPVDVLINNAGVSQRSLALDTTLDVYRQLMEVDYLAPLALTQLVLARMVERRAGHIAVVSSVAGKVGAPMRTGYCGAKHAVCGYFDALRAEVETAYGIQVSVILPGSVRTSVSVNALEGDGSSRGRSDTNIDNGMPADAAADIILAGMAAGQREIPVAEGMELAALQLRTHDPERLYGLVAQEGARLAALREQQGTGQSLDPGDVRSLQP
ncbi:MAG: putative oxidoreductase [Rhizobacter sp.]|nr:putative oxidoreductase [Rhizobacter sp.]